MTRTATLRITWIAALFLILLTIIPADGLNIASAKNGKGAACKVSKASHSSKERGSKRTRRHHHRSYTVRGNPEVTRRVAMETIMETLPELAPLAGIPTTDSPSQTESPAPVALTGTKSLYGSDTYQDSELDDKEDTDQITAEDEQDLEDLPTDINSFYKEFTSYMATLNGGTMVTDNGVDKQVVMQTLMDWLGTRYLFGGIGRNGIDCSAFTGTVYRSINYPLPRTAAAQWEVGSAIDRENLQFGDLVFFHTRQAVYVSHVGLYLGNHMFAHASSRNGVTVSSLDADYYTTHFIGGRRYNVNSVASTSTTGSAAISGY